MQPPEDVKSLQSFVGLVKYLTRYSAHLATITAPLRELMKKDQVAYVLYGAQSMILHSLQSYKKYVLLVC